MNYGVDDENCKSHLSVHRRQKWSENEGREEGSIYPPSFLLIYTNFPLYKFNLSRSPSSLPYLYSSCTSLMLDTSQSYLLLRRGSSDDEFEKPPFLEKQQWSPPKWKDILFTISGLTNVAALFSILSYLFFFPSSPSAHGCPATPKCTAATTAYPQTSYSKPEPAVTMKGLKVGGRGRRKEGGRD